ncbi:MAG: hypothetical protein OEM79_02145 [Nitrosopumilus sp.]|nr:hypothetical protein [Nitrosopumilus sp.]
MIYRVVTIWWALFTVIVFSSLGLAQAEHYLDVDDEDPLFEFNTKPTFGLDHENSEQIIDEGFKINDQAFDITNNFHTPFEDYKIEIGNINSFESTVYAPKGLKIQEFLFGIPEVGDAHLAELRIEVWFGLDGQFKNFKVVQDSDVIDAQHVIFHHEKIKCQESDDEQNCDNIKISIIFLEPLKEKIIAIKAIDFENRYQITYLNEGIDISGQALNPKTIKMIPSPKKYEGLIPVTQVEKYSSYWQSEDGRMFENNEFGTFDEIGIKFKRFQDRGDPNTRLHSGFSEIIDNEQKKALNIFDSSKIISKLPDSYTIDMILGERITDEFKEKMLEQEKIAQLVIEKSTMQARF